MLASTTSCTRPSSSARCLDLDGYVGRRLVSYLPMAHIAERMTSHYQGMLHGFTRHVLPRPDTDRRLRPRGAPRGASSACPACWEKIYAGVKAAAGRRSRRKRQFDEGVAAALEIKAAERAGTATQEQLDTWAFLDAVAFSHRPPAHRARRGDRRHHRGRTDQPRDPRVVQRHRRAAVGDLRHERVVGPDDVGGLRHQARHRRAGHPRLRGAARRRRRGDLPGRQRVPGLPQGPGEDRRDAHRRLAPLGRHRRASTTTATSGSSTARRS